MALLAAAVALVAIGALAVGSGRFSRSEPTTPSVAPSIAAVPSTVPVLRIELAAPGGGVQATATPADMAEVVRVLEARVAATGVVGGTVVRAGPLRVTVELPGVADSHDPIVSRIGQIGPSRSSRSARSPSPRGMSSTRTHGGPCSVATRSSRRRQRSTVAPRPSCSSSSRLPRPRSRPTPQRTSASSSPLPSTGPCCWSR